MNTTKPQNFKRAFVLEDEDLRRLEDLLKRYVSPEGEYPAKYEVRLSDSSVRTAGSLDEVLRIENSKPRRITSMIITTPYGNPELHARLSFENDRNRSISYHLTGEDDRVVALSDRLDEYLLGVRPWYSFLTRFSALFFVGGLYVVAYVALALAAAADYFFLDILPGEPAISSSKSDPLQAGVLVVLVAVALIVSGVLDWVLKKIFPVGTFAVGQGDKRHRTLGKVRGAIVGLLLLTIPSGFFVNYFS